MLLKGVADDFVWACSGAYGPNEDNHWGALWEELSRMHCKWNTAWCVFGISIPFDIQVRDLVVRLLVRLYLLFQTSLWLITLWTYPLKGLCLLGLEIQGQFVCQELIEPWH